MAHLNTAESRSAEGRGGAEDPGDVTSPWLNGKLELEKRRSYVLMNIWHQIVFLFFFWFYSWHDMLFMVVYGCKSSSRPWHFHLEWDKQTAEN